MSGEVLSQAEVESLLNSLDGGVPRDADKAKAARPKDKISLYDFRRPERVGKEQVHSLQTLHEGFSRNFAAALSTLLRSIVDVKLTSVDQLTYSEFIFSLENPTCFNLLRADPLEGHLILDISPTILYPIIDRLLGGGKDSGPPTRRPLTEIELRLTGKITGIFLEELQRAWQNVLPLELSVVRVESNPQLVQIVPPNEVVVLIGFELTLGEIRGMMNLCIPFNSIERMADKLTANSWTAYRRGEVTAESMRQTSENLRQATVEVMVELASTSLSTAELIGLRVGDIITTPHDVGEPLEVHVAGAPKFLARPGTFKGHKAIRVEGTLGEGAAPAGAKTAAPAANTAPPLAKR
jgi:flagellar motor switch protein FliM